MRFTLLGVLSVAAGATAITLDNVRNVFTFGDSFSANGYAPEDGLLNFPGFEETLTGGFTWAQYLAGDADHSRLFNFARIGACVDNDIIGNASIPSFVDQVAKFKEYFVPAPEEVEWTGANSLFTVMFTINDVSMGAAMRLLDDEFEPPIDQLFERYEQLVDELYEAGARSMILGGVPPMERTPEALAYEPETRASFHQDIEDFNEKISCIASSLADKYADFDVVFYDAYAGFKTILDAPAEYGLAPEVIERFCDEYSELHGEPLANIEACHFPLRQYFWLNNVHATYPVHALVASDIARILTTGDGSDMSFFRQSALVDQEAQSSNDYEASSDGARRPRRLAKQ